MMYKCNVHNKYFMIEYSLQLKFFSGRAVNLSSKTQVNYGLY